MAERTYTPTEQTDRYRQFPVFHARDKVAELAAWVNPREDKYVEKDFIDLNDEYDSPRGWCGTCEQGLPLSRNGELVPHYGKVLPKRRCEGRVPCDWPPGALR